MRSTMIFILAISLGGGVVRMLSFGKPGRPRLRAMVVWHTIRSSLLAALYCWLTVVLHNTTSRNGTVAATTGYHNNVAAAAAENEAEEEEWMTIYTPAQRAVILLRPSLDYDEESPTLQVYQQALVELRKNRPQMLVREYACGALQQLSSCLEVYGTIPTSPVIVRRWEDTQVFEQYSGPMQLEVFYAWILFQDQNHRDPHSISPYSELPRHKQQQLQYQAPETTADPSSGQQQQRQQRQGTVDVEIGVDTGPWGSAAFSSHYSRRRQQEQQKYASPPPRPAGQGVYIYKEPWATILDKDCGVTTLANQQKDEDDEDVPIMTIQTDPAEKIRDAGNFAVLRHFLRHTVALPEQTEAGYNGQEKNATKASSNTMVVVTDPDLARWFVVPFDFDRSYALGDCVGGAVAAAASSQTPGPGQGVVVSTHLQRTAQVLQGIAASEYYQRRQGADHVYVILHYNMALWRKEQPMGQQYFPQQYRYLLEQSIVLRYMNHPFKVFNTNFENEKKDDDPARQHNPAATELATKTRKPKQQYLDEASDLYGITPYKKNVGQMGNAWWLEMDDWRCTITVPLLTPHVIEQAVYDTSFEGWLERPYLFHYRGHGMKQWIRGTEPLHRLVLAMRRLFPPGKVLIERDYTTRAAYADELQHAKFCLIVRGDDPQRSRWNEAVASGCIPVQINDGFDLVITPNFDHDRDFTITIPERMFLTHAPSALYFAYGLPVPKLRYLHQQLHHYRPLVCWNCTTTTLDHQGTRHQPERNPQHSVGYLAWQQINDYCDLE